MTENLEYSLWSRLQGQSMPYCIPPTYRFFFVDHLLLLLIMLFGFASLPSFHSVTGWPIGLEFLVAEEHGAGQSPCQQAEWAKERDRKQSPPCAPQTPRASSQCSTTFSGERCHNTTLRIQPLTFGSLADTEHLNCGSKHCWACWWVPVPTLRNPHYPSLLPR